MKKILLALTLFGLSALPLGGFAQNYNVPNVDAMDTLSNLVNWLFSILIIVAAICIVVAGYYFVTAAGDPDTVKKARDFVIFALIGVLVALLARGLVNLVQMMVK